MDIRLQHHLAQEFYRQQMMQRIPGRSFLISGPRYITSLLIRSFCECHKKIIFCFLNGDGIPLARTKKNTQKLNSLVWLMTQIFFKLFRCKIRCRTWYTSEHDLIKIWVFFNEKVHEKCNITKYAIVFLILLWIMINLKKIITVCWNFEAKLIKVKKCITISFRSVFIDFPSTTTVASDSTEIYPSWSWS